MSKENLRDRPTKEAADIAIEKLAVRLHSRMEQMGLSADGDWADLADGEREAYRSCVEWVVLDVDAVTAAIEQN